MSSLHVPVIAILLIFLTAAAVLAVKVPLSRRRRLFGTRRELSLQEWCDLYYPNHDESMAVYVNRILQTFSAQVGCKPTQILPADRFDRELKLPFYLFVWSSDDWESVFFELEGLFAEKLNLKSKVDLSKIKINTAAWHCIADVIASVGEVFAAHRLPLGEFRGVNSGNSVHNY
jgi:hypothetical protein